MRLVDLTVSQTVFLILAAPFLFAIGQALLCVLVALIDAFINRNRHDDEA